MSNKIHVYEIINLLLKSTYLSTSHEYFIIITRQKSILSIIIQFTDNKTKYLQAFK